ncbi:MAG: PIG-L family deacetylase [Candidatus Hydrogenedentes bacterium]|nr:PIG-L family deacetylase [Candidatus Hydrogenedentota bacterium]
MKFHSINAEIYVPDHEAEDAALARTTHIGIGAHQDDLEIMAIDGILCCKGTRDACFAGVIVTDGAGSPRAGVFEDLSDEQMVEARNEEQKRASDMGAYGAQVLLGYPSAVVKDRNEAGPVDDIEALLSAASPEVVYTHNLMDKHDAHVAVALRVIEAIRRLPRESRPGKLYGCEVWRDLDWLPDEDKVVFDCSAYEDLQRRLLEVFESQIAGGKRYDLATMGRRRANATYFEPHQVDEVTGAAFGVDMTPLVQDDGLDIVQFASTFTAKFQSDVTSRLRQ